MNLYMNIQRFSQQSNLLFSHSQFKNLNFLLINTILFCLFEILLKLNLATLLSKEDLENSLLKH